MSGLNRTEQLVAQIISAREDAFAVLGFSADEPEIEPAAIRSAFRKRALIVHPDKCADERAADAFRVLSEAFENMHNPAEQQRLRRAAAQSSEPSSKKRRAAPSARSWKEWEVQLRQYEELEECFRSMQRSRYANRRAASTLRKAERVCVELDERAAILDNELLPPGAAEHALHEVDGTAGEASTEHDPERLVRLLVYLRATHRYCLFCGAFFQDDADLRQNCPGALEEAHEDAGCDAPDDDDDDYADFG